MRGSRPSSVYSERTWLRLVLERVGLLVGGSPLAVGFRFEFVGAGVGGALAGTLGAILRFAELLGGPLPQRVLAVDRAGGEIGLLAGIFADRRSRPAPAP